MKKLEFTMWKGYNKIIAILLSLLGFSGCEDPLNTKAEYGVPSADFIVKGKVLSKTSSLSIPNIRVILKDTSAHATVEPDTVYSNSEGNYELKVTDFPTDNTYNLNFSDIDGTLNGEYASKDTLIEFVAPVFTNGDGHWYSGKTTKEATIKLDPKK
jgi:putative lipoprotein (rSAM/lipoprotein system)